MVWEHERHSENIAVIDDQGEKISYKQMTEVERDISSVIDHRCLVFLLCSNSIGSIVGYSAFVRNRVVPLLINQNLEHELCANLVQQYLPEYIWVNSEKVDQFTQYGVRIEYSKYGYVLLRTDFGRSYQLNDDLCLLLSTSGSTGSPKFVRQSYANVLSNAQSIAEYLSLDSSERPITTLPMNYTYGLSIINSHFLVGATILVSDKSLLQKDFWSFFKAEEATSFGGVPYTYEILDKLRFSRMQLPSLRYSTQAGGKLTPELHKKFAEDAASRGTKFIVMYGQCEATARMGYLPADRSLAKCGSMGIAIPGGRFELIDASGQKITTPNTTGELIYYGPNVTMGYAESGLDLSKGDERGGVLSTGDMAQFDEEGFYYIVGRKKRFLKIYGNRVNLDEIDRMIKSEFDNLDCASAGVDDHMYIFLTEDTIAEPVKDYVVKKTGLNQAAFKTVIIPAIPKNDSGKVLYSELTQYYS